MKLGDAQVSPWIMIDGTCVWSRGPFHGSSFFSLLSSLFYLFGKSNGGHGQDVQRWDGHKRLVRVGYVPMYTGQWMRSAVRGRGGVGLQRNNMAKDPAVLFLDTRPAEGTTKEWLHSAYIGGD